MTEVERFEEQIKKSEHLCIRANDRILNLKNQYVEKSKELKSLGINPKTAEEDLKAKIKLRDEKLKKAFELLPEDVIKKFENYDFAGVNSLGENEVPDVDQAF